MKKSILTIGKVLDKAEQKEVHGGLSLKMCSDNSGDQCNPNLNGSDCGPTVYGSLTCPSAYDCLCPIGQSVGTCYAIWA
ncbi:MAG: hypothetical protein JKY02_07920 [Flavobacteriaceae bacterium]|nr:hypothetical protein [Flavobacteriaceae bacterium]